MAAGNDGPAGSEGRVLEAVSDSSLLTVAGIYEALPNQSRFASFGNTKTLPGLVR